MPTSNENFFTRERMQAIGLGIGRGFQSYDPNNPFAGAGAAMEATIGAEMGLEQQRKARSDRQQDLADIEDKQIRAEVRAEQQQIRAEERQRENARRDQQEMLDRFKKMRVGVVDPGRAKKASEWQQFANWFANLFGGKHPRVKGRSPISLYDESMTREPSAPDAGSMARPIPGQMGDPDLWDEEMDAVDPYAREIMQGVR